MLITYDPDRYVAISEHRTCPFHQANPDIPYWPGCSCMSSWSQREATPEEYAENRRRRLDREQRFTEWLQP